MKSYGIGSRIFAAALIGAGALVSGRVRSEWDLDTGCELPAVLGDGSKLARWRRRQRH